METKTLPASLSPEEHRLLGMGVVNLSDQSNVAYGSPGYCLGVLADRGLMKLTVTRLHFYTEYRYSVTRAGRNAYVSYGRPYVPHAAT